MELTYRLLFSVGIVTLIFLALLGNALVCLAVYFSRNLRSRINYIIVSLAVTDLLIASIAMPLWLMFEMTHFENLSPKTLTKIVGFWNFIDMLGGITSIANLAAISCERLWSVWCPLHHRRNMTNKAAGFIILSVWIYGILVAVSTASLSDWNSFPIFCAVMGFFLPLLLIIGAYVIIAIIVKKTSRNIISNQENIRINIAIVVIVLLFVICWAPYFIALLLFHYSDSFYEFLIENFWLRSLLKFLHYSNSCVNPVVYVIANAQYKDGFKIVIQTAFKCCFKKGTNTSQMSTGQLLIRDPSFSKNSKTLISCSSKSKQKIFINKKRPKSDAETLCGPLTTEDKRSEFFHNHCIYQTDEYPPNDYCIEPGFTIKTDYLSDPETFKEIQLSLTRTSYI
ncbi:5-hydroxytryptamine receptor 1A [Hydra vulgaris]|uniref:5-hydroxytryptamine receptor 1A n=1 Tax=Hydra vulgaris TaxID=6087 RepID=A0ABM4BIG2_HYDVU